MQIHVWCHRVALHTNFWINCGLDDFLIDSHEKIHEENHFQKSSIVPVAFASIFLPDGQVPKLCAQDESVNVAVSPGFPREATKPMGFKGSLLKTRNGCHLIGNMLGCGPVKAYELSY